MNGRDPRFSILLPFPVDLDITQLQLPDFGIVLSGSRVVIFHVVVGVAADKGIAVFLGISLVY